MAGGLGRGGKKGKRTGLVSELASQAEAEQGIAEARSESSPANESLTAGLTLTTEEEFEKVGWLVPVGLADRVRDAVAFARAKGIRVNGRLAAAGSLVAPAVEQLLDQLEHELNDGRRFPKSNASAAAQARRRKQGSR